MQILPPLGDNTIELAQGVKHTAPEIDRPSMYAPVPGTLSSVPRRHLNTMDLLLAVAGKLIVVVTHPPELPVHAERLLSGLPQQSLIAAL